MGKKIKDYALIYRKKIYSRTTISRLSKTVSVTRSILYAEHVNQILNVNYIILYCKIRSLLMILLSQSWIKGTRCVHQFQTCSLRTLFFILSILNIFETQWLFNVNLSSRYMYTDIIQSDLLLFLLNPTLKTFNNAYSNSSMVDKKTL